MEALRKEGMTTSIGVSNFRMSDIEELMKFATVRHFALRFQGSIIVLPLTLLELGGLKFQNVGHTVGQPGEHRSIKGPGLRYPQSNDPYIKHLLDRGPSVRLRRSETVDQALSNQRYYCRRLRVPGITLQISRWTRRQCCQRHRSRTRGE